MQKVKKTIKTALAGVLMAGAFAVPAGATSSNTTTNTDDSYNDNSKTTTYNLSECSGIVNSNQSNSATNVAVGGSNVGGGAQGGVVADQTQTVEQTAGNASASSQQSNSVTFAPNCSKVTNVTQAAASTNHQVKKSPRGAVSAGAGGASSEVSVASILGVAGSVATMGAGLVLRRQGFNL